MAKSVQVKSWFYTNTAEYGSPEHDVREDSVASTELSDDGLTLGVKLKGFGKGGLLAGPNLSDHFSGGRRCLWKTLSLGKASGLLHLACDSEVMLKRTSPCCSGWVFRQGNSPKK